MKNINLIKRKELDFNSPGLYYFKNKEIIKKYFKR